MIDQIEQAADEYADASQQSKPFNLKEALKRDFDIDLNISTGEGASRDDPVVILDASPYAAALTEMNFLLGLGLGMRVFWKVSDRTSITYSGKVLEKVQIETKAFSEKEVETVLTNYYFDIGLSVPEGEILPDVNAHTDPITGITMPFGLGFLHFSKMTNYEIERSGLGISLAYSSPEVEATIYIYDMNIKNIPSAFDDDIVQEQYKQSVNELKVHYPEAIVTQKASYNTSSIYEFFVTDDTHKKNTVLALSVIRGKFVKLRMTAPHDLDINKISMEFFSIFQQIVGRYRMEID